MAMEEPGAVAASSTPAATSISAEIDSMFADVTSDSSSDSSETESSPAETESAPSETAKNPQDSTVQAKTPIDYESDSTTEEPAVADPAKPATEPVEAAPEVPEDERGGEEYEQRGKKWIRYPEARGKEVFAGYQAAKMLTKELNLPGPVTQQTVQALASDKRILDNIDFDLMSPDPAEQAKAFAYLFSTAQKAMDQKHTAHNPKETMADALLHAASVQAPEVIRGLEQRINAHTFDGLYKKALAAGLDTDEGKILLSSVQRADIALTGNYRKKSELLGQPATAAPDPLATQRQELADREQHLNNIDAERSRAQWDAWYNAADAQVEQTVWDAIGKTLKPVDASLKNFPQTRKNVEIRLREEIRDALVNDQKFVAERARCFKQASIAGSESVRESWRARVMQLYAARAEQVLREKAPAILSESAQAIKAKSDQTHKRLAGTQSLRGTPAGGNAPNGTTAPPASGSKFDSKSWANELEAAFN